MGLAHTYKTRSFGGKIVLEKTTGRKRLKLHSDRFYQNEVNKFKVGDEISMSMTNKRPRRTEQQNRYYWGVYLPLIAEETGEKDLDALHNLFKGKFLTTGIKKIFGAPVRVTKSTTDLSVSEFIEFVMAIENFTGVSAPPTENYGMDPLERG